MTTRTHRPAGRPPTGYTESHSVVTKWDDDEMAILRQIAARHNTKPGPFLTNFVRAQLANIHNFQPQEALPIDKAS